MRPQTKIRQDGEATAMIFDGPKKAMNPAVLPLPSVLAPGEAIVKIELATICGSDLHIIAGHREQKTPAILGHEAVGRVVESARKNLSPGDRVSWSIAASCGECSFCRRYDLPQKCASLFKYQAVLVSRKGTKFDTIESLRGSVLGLTDPASTSGNLLPRVSFTKVIGEDLDAYFSRVVYTGGHDKSALATHEGKVDTAFVASHRFDNVVDRGLIKLADFNVLWRSPFIPGDPFTYRGKLCEDLKTKIRDTFLTLHNDPGAQKFLDNLKTDRFVPMSSTDYDIVRELRRAKAEAKKKS